MQKVKHRVRAIHCYVNLSVESCYCVLPKVVNLLILFRDLSVDVNLDLAELQLNSESLALLVFKSSLEQSRHGVRGP